MKSRLFVSFNGQEHIVEIEPQNNANCYFAALNGQDFTLDVCQINDSTLSLLIDGKSFDIDCVENGENLSLCVNGDYFDAFVCEERLAKIRSLQGVSSSAVSSGKIASPMPGKVLRVLVSEGESVIEGQGLLVIEAMKMENELRATKTGVIQQIFARPGTTVESHALLMVID